MNTPRTALEELDRIDSRFVSGNSVPVERTHITSSEWSAIRKALSEALGGEPTAADVVAWRYKFYDSGWILSDDDTDIQRIIRNGIPLQRLIVHPDDIPPPPTSARGDQP